MQPVATEYVIDPETTMGPVALEVRDLSRAASFYEEAIGLVALARDPDAVVLGSPEGAPLVALLAGSRAARAPANATGLYHLAIALPRRSDLARWLRHAAGLDLRLGQSDHGTHEAFYLNDAEGNGIEIYHDWPEQRWPMAGGKLGFVSKPVDVPGLLATLDEAPGAWQGVPAGTRMGHVHLKVRETAEAASFYGALLGFKVTAAMESALFVAAGDYHHHLGANSWHSLGGPAPAPGSLGLRHFTVVLPGDASVERLVERLEEAQQPLRRLGGGVLARDPAGNALVLQPQPATAAAELEHLRQLRSG